MPSKKKCSLNCIRKKAEQIIQEEPLILPAMNVEQQQSLIHELHVHQIELKLQNEELITTQQRLERTRNKYSDLFNNAPVGYLILDRTGFILEANQTFADMAGYPANRVVKRPFGNFLTPSTKHLFISQFRAFFKSPETKRMDLQLRKRDRNGQHIALYGSRNLLELEDAEPGGGNHERIRIVVIDISDQRQAEEAMQASLAEKEILLKEIHHRVKNNLQVISSLVDLQSAEIRDPGMKELFKDVVYRVRSMATVHEKLYQSTDLAHVDFADNTRSFLSSLWRAQGAATKGIRLDLDLDPVLLPVSTAVPCGLILNELFSNALKHAFKGRDHGKITVRVHDKNQGDVKLCVKDDGVGIPPEIEWETPSSLGLRLVQMLAIQLHATVRLKGDKGTEFIINFEVPQS